MFTGSKGKKKKQQEEKDAKTGSSKSNSKDVDPKQTGSKAETSAPVNETDFSQPVPGYESLWQGFNTEARRKVWEDYREKEQAKAGEAQAKAELEAAGEGGLTSIRTTLGNMWTKGVEVPSRIKRVERLTEGDAETGNVKEGGAPSRSGTALPAFFFVPSDVTVWKSFQTDVQSFDMSVRGGSIITVEKLHKPPREEKDMVENWMRILLEVSKAVQLKDFVWFSEREVCEVNEVVDATIRSRPDISLYNKRTKVGFVMFEGKADDNWPAKKLLKANLHNIWKVGSTKAQFSLEQKPIVQLTTHMCLSKSACGVLFNGIVAHFCHLKQDGVLECAGPFLMDTPEFWNAFLPFVLYANSLEPWSGNLVPTMKAAASGALDGDPDRFGDGEDVKVEVPGPSLPQEFVYENFQDFLNNGTNERPMAWVRNVEGQDVVVKAVDHEMDTSGFFRSELAHEVEVYKDLNEKGARDFIPEFVTSGKLPGGDRSALVTKFAGDCVEFWKPKNKSEAMEVYNKAVDALTSLHKLGYLHGDVALRNFVLDPETKKVRVIDLGRSEELDEKSNPEYEVDALKSEFRRLFPRYFE